MAHTGSHSFKETSFRYCIPGISIVIFRHTIWIFEFTQRKYDTSVYWVYMFWIVKKICNYCIRLGGREIIGLSSVKVFLFFTSTQKVKPPFKKKQKHTKWNITVFNIEEGYSVKQELDNGGTNKQTRKQ